MDAANDLPTAILVRRSDVIAMITEAILVGHNAAIDMMAEMLVGKFVEKGTTVYVAVTYCLKLMTYYGWFLSAVAALTLLGILSGDGINGTGYGGNHSMDESSLAEGRKKAADDEAVNNGSMATFLIKSAAKLRSSEDDSAGNLDPEDSSKHLLTKTLTEIFRKYQAPTEWEKHKKILLLSLTCLSLLLHNKKFHEGTDAHGIDESLACAFRALADQAHFLRDHGSRQDGEEMDHQLLATKILNVHSIMATDEMEGGQQPTQQQEATVDNSSLDDHQTIYRNTLGPLRFEFAESFSSHAFSSSMEAGSNSSKNMRRLFQELSAYTHSLPVEWGSSIFVRAKESQLDVLRVLIIGPDGTPYANGCYIFDVSLQKDYPNKPPQVKFQTAAGQRINPNLYADGKVCLSLLGTFTGPGWIAGESTLLQVLVSIQSLIFNADPMYNEPGVAMLRRLPFIMDKASAKYNRPVRRHTLAHALAPFLPGGSAYSLYPEFQEVLQHHFGCKKEMIQDQMTKWVVEDADLSGLAKSISSRMEVAASSCISTITETQTHAALD